MSAYREPAECMRALTAKLQRPSIPCLDGVRAIAALIVVFYHYGWPSFVPSGQFGVLIFFVLSGFLITWLLLKENEKTGTVSLRGFYRRRVLRIFPAFYGFWILWVAGLAVLGMAIPWRECGAAFFYISDYYYGLAQPGHTAMGHTWSLSVEEQFYLLWPFVFVRWRRDLARLSYLVAGMIGCVWVYRAVLYFVVHAPYTYMEYTFDARLDQLMWGCLLAILMKRGVGARFWRLASAGLHGPAVTIALLAASVSLDRRFHFPYRLTLGFMVEPPLVAILIVQLIALSTRAPVSWLEWGWVRYLGRISYPLYLYHTPVLMSLDKLLPDQRIRVVLPLALGLSLTLASLSYRFIEQPFLRLKAGLKKPRPEAAAVQVGA